MNKKNITIIKRTDCKGIWLDMGKLINLFKNKYFF